LVGAFIDAREKLVGLYGRVRTSYPFVLDPVGKDKLFLHTIVLFCMLQVIRKCYFWNFLVLLLTSFHFSAKIVLPDKAFLELWMKGTLTNNL
jgi:hypothetical protein